MCRLDVPGDMPLHTNRVLRQKANFPDIVIVKVLLRYSLIHDSV